MSQVSLSTADNVSLQERIQYARLPHGSRALAATSTLLLHLVKGEVLAAHQAFVPNTLWSKHASRIPAHAQPKSYPCACCPSLPTVRCSPRIVNDRTARSCDLLTVGPALLDAGHASVFRSARGPAILVCPSRPNRSPTIATWVAFASPWGRPEATPKRSGQTCSQRTLFKPQQSSWNARLAGFGRACAAPHAPSVRSSTRQVEVQLAYTRQTRHTSLAIASSTVLGRNRSSGAISRLRL